MVRRRKPSDHPETVKHRLVHDPDTEYRMLDANVREGGTDGMVGRPIMKVDGISVEVNQGLVRQLREMVATGLLTVHRPF